MVTLLMSVKGLYRKGTSNSYDIDLEELLENQQDLPFSYLIGEDKDRYFEDFVTESQAKAWRHKNSENKKSEIVPINEASRLELIKGADIARKMRAKKLHTKYMGVTNARGWITFSTNSQYTPGKKYIQYIKLNEAKDMKHFKEFKKSEIIRLFLTGDLSVYCSCPDFKYRGFKYMGTQMGYGIFRENRFPKIRNPKLEGTVCKHLLCVLSVLNTNWASIARDMKRSKFFKRKYEDDEYMKELENMKVKKKSKK